MIPNMAATREIKIAKSEVSFTAAFLTNIKERGDTRIIPNPVHVLHSIQNPITVKGYSILMRNPAKLDSPANAHGMNLD